MFYTIYKITNTVNNKYYIGKHQTKDLSDGYMGSGTLLKRAIKKYGVENFSKEILHVFETEEEMNAKEKELVQLSENSYNLCEGGKGGFGYINQSKEITAKRDRREFKIAGRIAANSKGAHIEGNKKHISLLQNDMEYKQRWKDAHKKGISKNQCVSCIFCGKPNLNPGNLAKHIKAYH